MLSETELVACESYYHENDTVAIIVIIWESE